MTRRAVWIVVAVVAVIAVAIGAGVWFATRPQGPDAVAREYLDALVAGDGARAMSLVEAPDDGVDRVAALDGARARIAAPEVVAFGFPAGTDLAGVAVRFTLDGDQWEADLSLRDTDAGWRVQETGLGALELSTDLGDEVEIGGVTVAAGPVSLLPAVYVVRAAPTALLVGESEATALPTGVAGSSVPPYQVAVDAELSPDAASLAQEQVDAYAEECTRPASEVADACGLLIPWPADLRALDAVAYRVEQLPTVAISADGRSFDATGGVVVATVTGTAHDGSAASRTYRDDVWALRGIVRVDTDGLTLGVR